MARIALGITILLLLAACFFSFQTKGRIQAFEGQVAELTTNLNNTKHQLATTEATLKTTQNDLAEAKTKIDSLTGELATTKDNLDKANAQVTDLTAQLKTANDKIAQLTPSTTSSNGVPTGPTQADYDKVVAQLKDAQAHVDELTQVKQTLTNKVKDAESRADDLQKVVDHYKNGTIRNGLEGEVLAVNQAWNFVVLSLGDRQGAVANAELILKRGGQQIGKVRITSVEPSTSVADIVPGSLARGVRVQPGDRVIFNGS